MVIAELRHRLRTDPGSPLLTHYDGDHRVELSGATFANWVDKTALFLDDLDVEPGSQVHLLLLETHPGHWVTSTWLLACWQRGCSVSTTDGPGLRVMGPHDAAPGGSTVMCSLHPLGLAMPKLPAGCVDYAEVLSQPDVHQAEPIDDSAIAWAPDHRFADIAQIPGRDTRKLFVDPRPGWASMSEIILAPIMGGGSTVVATNVPADRIPGIESDERTGVAP
ncbi:MAG: TIGR03089 family protein [Arachnia sp.]